MGGPKNTSVSLVASDGVVVATASVDLAPFRMHALMSWTSASQTRLYYLNAGSEVRFLAPDGTKGTATRIALGATEQAGFAVSPDDTRIAVAIFNYTLTPGPPATSTYNGMRLYVEDLSGGGHHFDIFSSPTVAEFPIAWVRGRLVLAVSEPGCCKTQPINPYDATSYHVADAGTGTRLADICGNSQGPEGPIEPIGAICYHPYTGPTFQRWDGSSFTVSVAVPPPGEFLNALSPDGTRVAVGQSHVWIWGGPVGRAAELNQSGYVLGWLDNARVVIQQIDTSALSVLEVDQFVLRSVSGLSPGGAYLGTFPAALT